MRTASEVLRSLEARIARLEGGRTASTNQSRRRIASNGVVKLMGNGCQLEVKDAGITLTEMPIGLRGVTVKKASWDRLSWTDYQLSREFRVSLFQASSIEDAIKKLGGISRLDFDACVGFIRAVLTFLVKKAEKFLTKEGRITPNFYSFTAEVYKPSIDTLKAVEVKPFNYRPIEMTGKDFHVSVKWESAEFSKLKDDYDYSEGMSAFYKPKTPAARRKLWFLLDSIGNISNLDFESFKALLTRNKIPFEYVPSVWR